MRRVTLMLAAMGAALVVASGVALAAQINCSSDPCLGTPGDDYIVGTNQAEVIRALAGNDEIDGLDGADTLYGGRGDDGFTSGIAGGNDSDTSYGGPGNDFLTDIDYSGLNNCGADTVRSSCTGRDTQYGGDGPDFLEGADEGDFLYGQAGRDRMFGGPGDDRLGGWHDGDYIVGEQGSDHLYGNRGNDGIDAAYNETAGSVDTVGCGRGIDEVGANENDVVLSNCEYVGRVPDATATTGVGVTAGSSSDSADDEQEKAREEFLANNKQGS